MQTHEGKLVQYYEPQMIAIMTEQILDLPISSNPVKSSHM